MLRGTRHSLVAWFGAQVIDARFVEMAKAHQKMVVRAIRNSKEAARMQVLYGGESFAVSKLVSSCSPQHFFQKKKTNNSFFFSPKTKKKRTTTVIIIIVFSEEKNEQQ